MYARRDDSLTTRFSQNFTGFTGSWGRLIQSRDEWIHVTRQDFEQVPGPIHTWNPSISRCKTSAMTWWPSPLRCTFTYPETTACWPVKWFDCCWCSVRRGANWMISHCSYSVPYQSTIV